MWGWIFGIIGGVIILMVIIKLATRGGNSGSSGGLVEQLSSIRRGFSGVCAKLFRRTGC